jgi:hypothetical protein
MKRNSCEAYLGTKDEDGWLQQRMRSKGSKTIRKGNQSQKVTDNWSFLPDRSIRTQVQ